MESFLTVHLTFLLSYFIGCRLLDIFCAQTGKTFHETVIEFAAAVLINDYNSMARGFVTKLNF